MANIFGGLDTPKYMSPEERSLAATRGAGEFGQLFGAAFRQRMAERDPLIQLKAAAYQTQMAEAASRLADSELSRRMKQNQIDSEAEDKLAFTNILTNSRGNDDAILDSLGQTQWKSPMGRDNATQLRLAIIARKSRDAFSTALSKLTPQGIARVSRFEPGSPEAWDAIELETKAADNKNIMPEQFTMEIGGRQVFGIRNPQTGSFHVIEPDKLSQTDLMEYRQLLSDRSEAEKAMGQTPNKEKKKGFQEKITELNTKLNNLLNKSKAPAPAPGGTPINPNKPRVINPDGSVSTERTITVEADGKFHVIPTIINGVPNSTTEAIKAWRSGNNKAVGVFGSQQEADDYATKRSDEIGRTLTDPLGLFESPK